MQFNSIQNKIIIQKIFKIAKLKNTKTFEIIKLNNKNF